MPRMPDLGPLAGAVVSLVGAAVSSFLHTILALAALGVALATGASLIAADGSVLRGILGAALALTVTCALGVPLAARRAVLAALLDGVRRHGVGRAAVDLVFERAQLGKTVERVPLAEAERRVRTAVAAIGRPAGSGLGGWVRRRLEQRLLRLIETITLARFREGGADLDAAAVRAELGQRADELLARRIARTLMPTTAFVLAGMVGLSLGGALLLRQLG